MFNREAAAQLTEALSHVPDGSGRPLGEVQASRIVERTANLLREDGTSQEEADAFARAWINRVRDALALARSIAENPQATKRDTRSMTAKELIREAQKTAPIRPYPYKPHTQN